MGFGAAECDGPAERCVLLVRVIVVEAQQGGRVGFCLAGEVRALDLRVVGGDAAELVRAGRELHPGAVLRGDGLRGAQHLVCFMRVDVVVAAAVALAVAATGNHLATVTPCTDSMLRDRVDKMVCTCRHRQQQQQDRHRHRNGALSSQTAVRQRRARGCWNRCEHAQRVAGNVTRHHWTADAVEPHCGVHRGVLLDTHCRLDHHYHRLGRRRVLGRYTSDIRVVVAMATAAVERSIIGESGGKNRLQQTRKPSGTDSGIFQGRFD